MYGTFKTNYQISYHYNITCEMKLGFVTSSSGHCRLRMSRSFTIIRLYPAPKYTPKIHGRRQACDKIKSGINGLWGNPDQTNMFGTRRELAEFEGQQLSVSIGGSFFCAFALMFFSIFFSRFNSIFNFACRISSLKLEQGSTTPPHPKLPPPNPI